MKVLNLNGQGLLVLLFFVFTACNHWGFSPEAEKGSGKMVSVRIGAINVAGGYQNETVRASGSEKRIVQEPIIQDLGNGMLAEITVEEDVSVLRDGEGTTLANSALYRVVVLDESDSYVAHKDFTMGADPGAIELEGNKTYHFICFSRNTSDELPDAGTGSETGFTLAATTANEIYWQKQTVTLPLGDDVSFLLRPQYAKVTLELHASGGGRTFDINFYPGSISLDAATSGNFNLATGNFTFTSGPEGITFSGWSYHDDKEVFSNPITFLPKTTGEYMLTIPASTLPLDDGTWPTVARPVFIPAEKFEKEKSYTLLVTLKEVTTSNKFAGSNIYWDEEEEELTFEPYSSTGEHKEYQGVFFKWGSLIGISPAQTNGSNDFSSGTTTNNGQDDGTPIYMKDPDGKWVKTNVAYATQQKWFGSGSAVENKTDGEAWSPIPSYAGENITDANLVGKSAHTLLAKSGAAPYLGDICNYINPAYRMPTGNELEALYNSDAESYYTGFTTSIITNQTANGKTALAQFGTFTGLTAATNITYYLPASAYRDNSSGTLAIVGGYGNYWSGSAADSALDLVYVLGFLFFDGKAGTDSGYGRSYGQSVRCVKIE